MNTSLNTIATEGNEDSANSGALWRKLWRLHFLAGLIIAPALIWFAFTGLVVLYTDVINSAGRSELHNVAVPAGKKPISLDEQLTRVSTKYPDLQFWSVTPAREDDRSNVFSMGDKEERPYNVYVNPYTGDVLGKTRSDKGIVAFANNTHGSFLPRQFTMPIPSLTGILGEGSAFRSVEIGEVIVEIVAGWGLVWPSVESICGGHERNRRSDSLFLASKPADATCGATCMHQLELFSALDSSSLL